MSSSSSLGSRSPCCSLARALAILTKPDDTAAVAQARGLPSPRLGAQISGVALLAGGIGVVLGVWTDLALLGIAVLVMLIAVTIHPFWTDTGDKQQTEMAMFMKNMAIVGAAITLFAFFAYGYDGWQLVGPALDWTP